MTADDHERARLEIAQQQRAASAQAVASFLLTQGIRSLAADWNEREARARWQQERARLDRESLCYLVRNSEGVGYDPERQLLAPARSRVLWEESAEP
jgi:hypothetical protein